MPQTDTETDGPLHWNAWIFHRAEAVHQYQKDVSRVLLHAVKRAADIQQGRGHDPGPVAWRVRHLAGRYRALPGVDDDGVVSLTAHIAALRTAAQVRRSEDLVLAVAVERVVEAAFAWPEYWDEDYHPYNVRREMVGGCVALRRLLRGPVGAPEDVQRPIEALTLLGGQAPAQAMGLLCRAASHAPWYRTDRRGEHCGYESWGEESGDILLHLLATAGIGEP